MKDQFMGIKPIRIKKCHLLKLMGSLPHHKTAKVFLKTSQIIETQKVSYLLNSSAPISPKTDIIKLQNNHHIWVTTQKFKLFLPNIQIHLQSPLEINLKFS